MSRIKLARQLIGYLEKKINCDNVINFADKNSEKQENLPIKKITVNNIPIGYEIINYNDTKNSDSNTKDKLWIKKVFGTFDFMTEANYTGFECFPYLYGVLDCHGGEDSRVYIFYEHFSDNLEHLIDNIQHPSEWYDIAFQIIMINYCIKTINDFEYNGIVQNHLYKKLEKPYYKEYELDGTRLNINHKYLIVLWTTIPFKKISDENKNFSTNIDYLLEYVSNNKEKIKIPPSNKIVKLLNDVQNSPDDLVNIILKYYAPTTSIPTRDSNDQTKV